MSALMAAWRDASFFVNPGVARRYHVVVADRPACSTTGTTLQDTRMTLNLDTQIPATEAPQHRRCQRNGCKQRWPKAAKAARGGEGTTK